MTNVCGYDSIIIMNIIIERIPFKLYISVLDLTTYFQPMRDRNDRYVFNGQVTKNEDTQEIHLAYRLSEVECDSDFDW